jgi:hypothetical protein
MKKLLVMSLLAASFMLGNAYAGNYTNPSVVDFPAGQTNGSFHCKVKDTTSGETVKIDTSAVDAQGFCAGGTYVTSPGHINGLPVTTLTTYFFQINKALLRDGSVKVTLNGAGGLDCKSGDGNGRTMYAPGGGYCLTASNK